MTTPELQPEGDGRVECSAWLACPFCGSANVGWPFDDRQCSWATCYDCEADGPLVRIPSDLHAYLAWNRRQANAELSDSRPL